jgi:hypothetical protein
MAIDHSLSRIFENRRKNNITVGTAGTPDERDFFGVADRAEAGCGQGFQYDNLVGSILQDDALEDTVYDRVNRYLCFFCTSGRV